MFAKNNLISGRQVMRLMTFELLGISALMMPGALAVTAGADGVFAIGVGLIFGVIYLWILKQALGKIHGTYSAYLTSGLGVFSGKLIKFGYWLYFLLFAGIVAAVFSELAGKELIEEQFQLILLVLMLMILYGVLSGIEGRARVYEILFWILLLPLGIMVISSFPTVDGDYWMPVLKTSAVQIAAGGYQVLLYWSALCLVPFFAEYVQDKNDLYAGAKRALILTGIVSGVIYMVLLGMFGEGALATMDYPVVTMMSRIQITGGFLKRIDAFMFGIWFFTLYALLSSLVFFGGCLCRDSLKDFVHAFPKGKEVNEQKLARTGMIAQIVLVYAIAYVFHYAQAIRGLFTEYLWYLGTAFVIAVPVLILIKDKGQKCAGTALGIVLCFFLNGCAATELENREFPVTLMIESGESFSKSFLESKDLGTKKTDYNHLKVIVIEQSFLEDETQMKELLTVLKQEKDIPWNAYVVMTDDVDAVSEAEENLEMPLGNYLEALLEHSDKVKKEAYPTIGMFYQEQENKMETLYLPYVSVEEDIPFISSYGVWKRGEWAGIANADTAMLSFFMTNQLKEYTLALEDGSLIRLSNPNNQIYFQEERTSGGLMQKQVVAEVACEGKVIYQTLENENENAYAYGTLENMAVSYMTETANTGLKMGVDITNSRKKLGRNELWYERYQESLAVYEEEIEILIRTKIKWTE